MIKLLKETTKGKYLYGYYIAIVFAFLVRLIWISLIPLLSNAPDESSHWTAVEYLSEYFRQPSSQEIVTAQVGAHVLQVQMSYFHMVISKSVFGLFFNNDSILIYICRITNALLSIVVVINCQHIFSQLIINKRIANLLAIALAFHPQYVFISSYVNNDVFACWITTLSIIVLLKILPKILSKLDSKNTLIQQFNFSQLILPLLCLTLFSSLFAKSSSIIVYASATFILLFIFLFRFKQTFPIVLNSFNNYKIILNVIAISASFLLGYLLYSMHTIKLSMPGLSNYDVFSGSFMAQVIFYPRPVQLRQVVYGAIFSSHSFIDYLNTITQMNYWQLIIQGFWGLFDNMSLRMNSLWYYFYLPYMISFLYGYFTVFKKSLKYHYLTVMEYTMCLAVVLMGVGSLSFSYKIAFQPQGRHFLPVLVIVYYFIAKGFYVFKGADFTKRFISIMIIGSVICTTFYVPFNLFSVY